MSFENPLASVPVVEKEPSESFSFINFNVRAAIEKGVAQYNFFKDLANYSMDDIDIVAEDSFDRLDERERVVLVSRFHGAYGKATQGSIGDAFDVSGKRIQYLEKEALRKFCEYISLMMEHKNSGERDILNLDFKALDIGTRSRNFLKDMDGRRGEEMKTIGDLVGKTEKELLNQKNSGKKSIDEIKVALAKHGLYLTTEEERRENIEQDFARVSQFIEAGMAINTAKDLVAKKIFSLEDIASHTEKEIKDLFYMHNQFESVKNVINKHGLDFKREKP